jgi:hypothetical protein
MAPAPRRRQIIWQRAQYRRPPARYRRRRQIIAQGALLAGDLAQFKPRGLDVSDEPSSAPSQSPPPADARRGSAEARLWAAFVLSGSGM